MNTSKQPKGSNVFTSKESLRMHPLNTMVLLLMFCYPRLLFMSVMPSKNNKVFAFCKNLQQNTKNTHNNKIPTPSLCT